MPLALLALEGRPRDVVVFRQAARLATFAVLPLIPGGADGVMCWLQCVDVSDLECGTAAECVDGATGEAVDGASHCPSSHANCALACPAAAADGALAAEPHHVAHFALFGVAARFDVAAHAQDNNGFTLNA